MSGPPDSATTPLHPLWLVRDGLRRGIADQQGYVVGRLLDLGCGWKPYAPLFTDQVTAHVGVDLPTSRSRSTVVDVYASGLALPFRAGAFDAVLCTEVLEHVPEPNQLLAEVARVLRPGGALVLTVPWLWATHELPHDYYRYTEFGLRYLLTANGFTVEAIQKTTGLIATAAQRFVAATYYGLHLDRTRPGSIAGRLFAAAMQLPASVLDRALGRRGETLNFVVAARRNRE